MIYQPLFRYSLKPITTNAHALNSVRTIDVEAVGKMKLIRNKCWEQCLLNKLTSAYQCPRFGNVPANCTAANPFPLRLLAP